MNELNINQEKQSFEKESIVVNSYCQKCGAILQGGNFCSVCGTSVVEGSVNAHKVKNKKTIIIVVSVVAVLVAFVFFGLFAVLKGFILPAKNYNSGMASYENGHYAEAFDYFERAGDYKDAPKRAEEAKKADELEYLKAELRVAYSKCSSVNTTLTSDGLGIIVDGEDENDLKSVMDALSIASELGLPESLSSEMTSTNALMGMQIRTYGNYEVSWSYHPDNGLDVIYKIVIE